MAKAGWFKDPEGAPQKERYWDGAEWSQEWRSTAPPPPTRAEAAAPLYAQQFGQPPKQRKRIFTWVIVGINVLFVAAIILAVVSNNGTPRNCGTLSARVCSDANNTGAALAVTLIVIIWVVADIILGILWLVTRKREPQQIIYVQGPPR